MTDDVGMRLEALEIGSSAKMACVVSAADIDAFAELSGDRNRLHMDDAYARSLGFSGRVVHGFMLGAKVSSFLGMIMPGPGCVLLEAQLSWAKPVYAGDALSIQGEIKELSQEQRAMKIGIRVFKEGTKAQLVARGWALCQSRP
jgi:3-hydroxybutyryl-CoA dehydratase